MYVYVKLLESVETSEVIDQLHRVVTNREVNWQSVLSLTSVLLVTRTDSKQLVTGKPCTVYSVTVCSFVLGVSKSNRYFVLLYRVATCKI